MQRPSVVHVEGRLGEFLRFVFVLREGEHMRMRQAQVSHRPVPEIGRHFTGYVAAEAVDTDGVHPPVHRFQHFCAHVLVVIVQFGDIRPVVLYHQVSEAVAIVPAFVLRPLAIRSGVVSYPVEDDLEALLMCRFEEVLEVRAGTKLRVDSAVVDDRVVTAERPLAGDDADGLTGHHPYNVDTVVAQRRKQSFRSLESTFRRSLTYVQFIDRRVVCKFRVTQRGVVSAADECHRSQRKP